MCFSQKIMCNSQKNRSIFKISSYFSHCILKANLFIRCTNQTKNIRLSKKVHQPSKRKGQKILHFLSSAKKRLHFDFYQDFHQQRRPQQLQPLHPFHFWRPLKTLLEVAELLHVAFDCFLLLATYEPVLHCKKKMQTFRN